MKNPHIFGAIYVVLALVGDAILKLWADKTFRPWTILLAMCLHAVASSAWGYQMRLGTGFGRSAVILIVANLAGAVVMARFLFNETFTFQHVFGMVAAVAAVILLA